MGCSSPPAVPCPDRDTLATRHGTSPAAAQGHPTLTPPVWGRDSSAQPSLWSRCPPWAGGGGVQVSSCHWAGAAVPRAVTQCVHGAGSRRQGAVWGHRVPPGLVVLARGWCGSWGRGKAAPAAAARISQLQIRVPGQPWGRHCRLQSIAPEGHAQANGVPGGASAHLPILDHPEERLSPRAGERGC